MCFDYFVQPLKLYKFYKKGLSVLMTRKTSQLDEPRVDYTVEWAS